MLFERPCGFVHFFHRVQRAQGKAQGAFRALAGDPHRAQDPGHALLVRRARRAQADIDLIPFQSVDQRGDIV